MLMMDKKTIIIFAGFSSGRSVPKGDLPLLHTANGITVVDQEVSMQIMSLMEDIHPLVLESTPAVLSVGKRCMEECWTLIWTPWKNPLLISPSGKKIHLKVHGNVPCLVENKNYAMPANAQVPGILPAGKGAAHHEEVRLPQESVGG